MRTQHEDGNTNRLVSGWALPKEEWCLCLCTFVSLLHVCVCMWASDEGIMWGEGGGVQMTTLWQWNPYSETAKKKKKKTGCKIYSTRTFTLTHIVCLHIYVNKFKLYCNDIIQATYLTMLKQTTNHTNVLLFVCSRLFFCLIHVDKALWKAAPLCLSSCCG